MVNKNLENQLKIMKKENFFYDSRWEQYLGINLIVYYCN